MAGARLVRSGTRPEPPASPDDEVLVARAQADPVAFVPLYDRYFDPIYRYCRYRLNDETEAEDASGVVFAQALAALPRFRLGAGSFRSWLFAIAHNTVANWHRAQRDVRPLDEVLHLVARDPAPEASALAAERRRELAAALAGLTPDQRRVIELRLAGLTGPESPPS